MPPGAHWLDVGCGTGAFTEAIVATANPAFVKGIDSSAQYIAFASERIRDRRAQFQTGDAQTLPEQDASYDVAVSGLMLNFVPTPGKAVAEMARATRPGGVVAAYVWDYAGKMELMRYFWDAAAALDQAANDLDEGRRFPLCNPEPLAALFLSAGLKDVEVEAIVVPTVFRDFDDYWSPFLGGQGPAPGYAMSLAEDRRSALREQVRKALPVASDGSISMVARAWAVRGRRGN
jgi:SAM-dependent methyltransferase